MAKRGGAARECPPGAQNHRFGAAFVSHLPPIRNDLGDALMVIGQNEAEFLRAHAARMRLLAEGCTKTLGEELLALAADFERRASFLDSEKKEES